jgi:hypothetical protein
VRLRGEAAARSCDDYPATADQPTVEFCVAVYINDNYHCGIILRLDCVRLLKNGRRLVRSSPTPVGLSRPHPAAQGKRKPQRRPQQTAATPYQMAGGFRSSAAAETRRSGRVRALDAALARANKAEETTRRAPGGCCAALRNNDGVVCNCGLSAGDVKVRCQERDELRITRFTLSATDNCQLYRRRSVVYNGFNTYILKVEGSFSSRHQAFRYP